MSTNILVYGDPHGRLEHVVKALLAPMPQAVVLLGDIESPGPLHLALGPIRDLVWWVSVNHDSVRVESWNHHVESELSQRRLDGRVVTLRDGTRLAGVGHVFRRAIWYPPADPRHRSYQAWLQSVKHRAGHHPLALAGNQLKHLSSIFPDANLQLAQRRADIPVTHEAGATHPHGRAAIDELVPGDGRAHHVPWASPRQPRLPQSLVRSRVQGLRGGLARYHGPGRSSDCRRRSGRTKG